MGSDLMIELEEAEHARYLENFDFIVQLNLAGENQFSFPISVSSLTLISICNSKYAKNQIEITFHEILDLGRYGRIAC